MAKKTWSEKMNPSFSHKLEVTDKKFADIPEGVMMLVPTPQMVDQYIKNIPEGVHTSLQQMRKDLAAEYGAAYTCPVTSGIFLRIAAEHAWEQYQAGKPLEEITPFWRMIDRKTTAAKKLSFGYGFVEELRRKEGLEA
ncbi:MAG: hypothetical protein EOP49_02390 [Sphingobacteriales bacterium]|nr:MAG: hypothetical protein EOP49_02390 [Sphingobacteriales bacterium]